MHWRTDCELQLRIALAALLIAALPFAFAYTFVFAANTIGIALLEWVTERPWPGAFYIDPIALTVVVIVGVTIQLRYGSRTVAGSLNARPVDPETHPEGPGSVVVTLAISALFWVASVLVHRVLSRDREYAADRASAALTGDRPLWLSLQQSPADSQAVGTNLPAVNSRGTSPNRSAATQPS